MSILTEELTNENFTMEDIDDVKEKTLKQAAELMLAASTESEDKTVNGAFKYLVDKLPEVGNVGILAISAMAMSAMTKAGNVNSGGAISVVDSFEFSQQATLDTMIRVAVLAQERGLD
jgi:hypothetical protein